VIAYVLGGAGICLLAGSTFEGLDDDGGSA
jgi:hypothetical protein